MSTKKPKRLCEVPKCGRSHWAKGLCSAHYMRKFYKGEVRPETPLNTPAIGSRNTNWKGGKIKERNRTMILLPSHPAASSRGYIYRYRLIMEKNLGRYLLPTEIVHHKDGDESNDMPQNLEVMTQSQHVKIHLKKKRTK